MQKLVQIIYISRSTFESTDTINKIEPNIVRILSKSRVNNRKNGLVGIMYFGDGAFFQCLEGYEESINILFDKIQKDPRHKDIKLISRKYISELSFPNWSMKYALFDKKMGKYLKENGYQTFDPYAFVPEMTEEILALLIDSSDLSLELESTSTSKDPQPSIKLSSDKNLILISLFFSITAFVCSLVALLSVRGTV